MSRTRSALLRRTFTLGVLGVVALLAVATFVLRTHPITIRRELPPSRMRHSDGLAWQAPAWQAPWPLTVRGDSSANPRRSRLVLLEDGVDSGNRHAPHRRIVVDGAAAYSHWHDTLHFSTSDGSDPQRNGRRYEVILSIEPAPSAVLLALAALGGVLGAGLLAVMRASRSTVESPHRDDAPSTARRKGRVAAMGARASLALSALGVAAAIGLFALALSSRWEFWCETRGISSGDLAANTPVAHYLAARSDAAHHDFRSISLVGGPLQQHAGNFREFVMPSTRHAPRRVSVTVSETELERTENWESFHEASDAGRPSFLATPNGIVVDLAGVPAGSGEVTLPVRASRATVVLLGVLSAGSLALFFRAWHRRRRGLPSEGALGRITAGAAMVGALLIIANLSSVVVPLRSPLVDDPEFTARNGLGPRDVELAWDEARVQLARSEGEDDVAYAGRMTELIARTVAHTWIPARAEDLRMQVPLWENWLLWLGGELSPSFRNYRFADPRRTMERGVGMCGQVSLALATLLHEQNIDARMTLLEGHALITLHREGAQVAVLDPDYGVVLPMTLEEARANASGSVKERYRQALGRITGENVDGTLTAIEKIFATPPIRVEAAGPVRFFGEHHAPRERLLYRLKWIIPVALLVPWIGLTILRRARSGRTGEGGRTGEIRSQI